MDRMRWAAFLLLGSALYAQTAQELEFFEKRIRPVFAAKCMGCHGPQASPVRAHLRLDSREGMRKGGDSGPAIVPGDAAKSLLMKAVSYTDLDLRMPPTGKLSDAEIADLRRWIDMGAPDPRTAAGGLAGSRQLDVERGKRHWAFRPVAKPAAKPEMAAGEPASKRVWLRRVTYDLTGLPPSREEMASYLADSSTESDGRVVERLLASPHYGERWARHWLDLVRFAETNGHEFDNDKLDAWRYRDYVIRAFNQDVPYNQFVREHIAGDLMPVKRLSRDGSFYESPIGTGFYWFGEVLNSAVDSVKSRSDQVDNQIDVMGKTFLGLTVACARCHDHKFDPVPTLDYYSLAGYLHSTAMQEAVIDSPGRGRAIGEAAAKVPHRQERRPETSLRENDVLFASFRGGTPDGWTAQGVPDAHGAKEFVGSYTSRKFALKQLWVHVLLRGTKTDKALRERAPLRVTVVADDHKSEHFFPGGKGWEWVTVRMTKEIGRICYFEIVDRARDGYLQVDRIVLSGDEKAPPLGATAEGAPEAPVPAQPSLPPSTFAMIAMDEDPGDTRVHIRGSHKNLGEIAPRRFLRVIAGEDQTPVEPGRSGRLALAEWMASERNPLTARVMVNRIWAHHFGKGLVPTPDNFGMTGERPSNPAMLDWLAARFVESGWSVKAVHREIVLSPQYRAANLPVRRLEAEAIRDALLAVSGSLDPAMYGRSVPPYISKYQDGRGKPKTGPLDGANRRSLYIEVRRNFLTPMFLAFDYPLPVSTTGARGASTVPSQALMMMNNEFVLLCAGRWAQRLEREEPDEQARVRRMFEEAFARPAEDWEVREVAAFARERGWKEAAHTLFNSAEFLYVQ
ncbi:MAG: PSD1 domain-containing protein [Bryobacterales bacterium]|nr:PSD1 domain-containing protein [Bryobacterales bacterium]